MENKDAATNSSQSNTPDDSHFQWLTVRVPKDIRKRINPVIRFALQQFSKRKETGEICLYLKRGLDEKFNRNCGDSWNVFAGETLYYNVAFLRASAGLVRQGTTDDPKALKILFYQSAPWEKIDGPAPERSSRDSKSVKHTAPR